MRLLSLFRSLATTQRADSSQGTSSLQFFFVFVCAWCIENVRSSNAALYKRFVTSSVRSSFTRMLSIRYKMISLFFLRHRLVVVTSVFMGSLVLNNHFSREADSPLLKKTKRKFYFFSAPFADIDASLCSLRIYFISRYLSFPGSSIGRCRFYQVL